MKIILAVVYFLVFFVLTMFLINYFKLKQKTKIKDEDLDKIVEKIKKEK